MLWKTLNYAAVLACAGLAWASLLARADDKDAKGKPTLSGSWVKKDGELKIQFADKHVLKIAPHGDEEVFVVRCTYTVEKGEVQAKITDFEGKDEAKKQAQEKLPIGTEFSFQWKVKDDTAKLDDLKGEKVKPLKSHLEGEYDRKK